MTGRFGVRPVGYQTHGEGKAKSNAAGLAMVESKVCVLILVCVLAGKNVRLR